MTTLPDGLVASTVMFAGRFSVGGVVSRMVTVKLPKAILNLLSPARQFTVVVPIPNVEPDTGVQNTKRGPSTRSVAVAV